MVREMCGGDQRELRPQQENDQLLCLETATHHLAVLSNPLT